MSKKSKLSVGHVIEVHGWVMLKGLEGGSRYKVKKADSYSYSFSKERGSNVVARHYISSVDPWVKPSSSTDNNKIVVVKSGRTESVVVMFGLEEAKRYPNLWGRLHPALEAFGKDVAGVVKRGLTHKPTKWSQRFYTRIPAYFIEFETTDRSDIEVSGRVSLIFDFYSPSLTYRVEIEARNAAYGPALKKAEYERLGSEHADQVGKGIVEHLRSMVNV